MTFSGKAELRNQLVSHYPNYGNVILAFDGYRFAATSDKSAMPAPVNKVVARLV